MPTRIRLDGNYAVEQSSYLIEAAFFDEDDQEVIPNSAKWSLTDTLGNVINSREDVVLTPAASVFIVLTGDDLALSTGFTGFSELRVLLIEAIYNSSHAAGLYLKDQLVFPVVNLAKIDTE
jgi:hypothetical protein